MNTICVIPAKERSTRLPGKNWRPFLGVPAVARSVRMAMEFGCCHVVVSTDSDIVAGIARKEGADVFDRSPETCTDESPMVDAVLEVLEHYDADYVLMLYPVAPFATFKSILEGFEKVRDGAHVAYPIYKSREHWELALVKEGDSITPLNHEYSDYNSQFLSVTYHSAGQWYWADVDWLKRFKTFTPMTADYVEIPAGFAVDIDTPEDWKLAELLYVREVKPHLARALLEVAVDDE